MNRIMFSRGSSFEVPGIISLQSFYKLHTKPTCQVRIFTICFLSAAPAEPARKKDKNDKNRVSNANRRVIVNSAMGEDSGQRHHFCFWPKSTLGALEISRSFSTVNCGFSLCPNIIAVKLVGNERTVTL